ncbi:MAG: SPOR domain-containing protein [Bacteroidales bacterium]|nr:SPOR domain-containing protein [Bacteroidales bacterium]
MNEIALHIDYLLHTHDCIIVPGLGGFVVNTTDVEKNGLWGLDAPTFELLFNNKLTYNDGLLAESLMKINNVSYDVAIKKIESACKELKSKLLKSEEVEWDNLGTFKTDTDNNTVFLANKDYVRPQFFGLSNARFKPVVLALSTIENDKNAYSLKSIAQYVSAAIAAAVVLFFVVLSFNNSTPNSQYAEIVSKPLIFASSASKTKEAKQTKPTAIVANQNLPSATKASNTVTQTQASTNNYYIIVGVYEVREIAEKSLSRLKSQGFETASMIETPRRLDVYSASFSNRDDAQTFLRNFKADNPQYKDAWILKR